MSELASNVQVFVEGKSEQTKQTYLSLARSLETYLSQKHLTLDTLKPIHMKELIYQQKAMNSRFLYKIFLKAFMRSLGRNDLVAYMKDNLREIREEGKFKVDLTLEEVFDLIDVTEQPLLKLAWALMAFDGLRPGEVLGLHFEDLDTEKAKVILRRREGERYGPKAKKPTDESKAIPFNPLSMNLFKQIPQGRGRILPISYKTFRKWFNRYVKKAEITREAYPVTMHKLRHFFGHFYRKRHGDIRILKEIMRHSNIKYTLLYTAPSDQEVEEDYRNVWKGVHHEKA